MTAIPVYNKTTGGVTTNWRFRLIGNTLYPWYNGYPNYNAEVNGFFLIFLNDYNILIMKGFIFHY